MRKFFIITAANPWKKENDKYQTESEVVYRHSVEFARTHNIESREYLFDTKRLHIKPTENDLKRYKIDLMVPDQDGFTGFKLNSLTNKKWVEFCKVKKLKNIFRPSIKFYLGIRGKAHTEYFDKDNKTYAFITSEHDYLTPDGFKRIKGSEYFLALESLEKNKEGLK